MEEIAVTGVVIYSMPYKEKDRLIHIFSLELGKVTAILKGVESPKSKLKYAGQPFCFAKFELAGSGEFYVVKGVELIDSFFDITQDYGTYALSLTALEVCSVVLKPNILAEGLFLTLIKTLQNIVYNNISPKLAILKFHLTVLEQIGYALNFESCDNCGMKFVGDIRYNSETGTFRCISCSKGEVVSRRDFMNLKILSSTNIDRLHTIRIVDESLDGCLKLVIDDINRRLNVQLRSANSIL